MAKISKISQQKNRSDRFNIYLDDEFALGVSQETLLKFNLKKGRKISKEKLKEIKKQENERKILDRAYHYLSYRDRSIKELKDYLKKKDYRQKLIKKTINKLKKKDILDDKKFAHVWIKDRITKQKGPRLIYSELIKKGVDKDIIEESLDNCYNKKEQKKIVDDLAKKRIKRKGIDLDNYKQRQKLLNYLARRGFEYDIIKDVVNNK